MKRRNRRIRKVVFTGGPCGAKSRMLKGLLTRFSGQVLVVPEAATDVLGGYPPPECWDEVLLERFQRTVVDLQRNREAAWAYYASQTEGVQLLLCDRGLLDGSGYLRKPPALFCDLFGLDLNGLYEEYLEVFHLHSLATHSPAKYEAVKASNPRRFESAEEACEVDRHLFDAWRGHPRHRAILAREDVDEKGMEVTGLVEELLAQLE